MEKTEKSTIKFTIKSTIKFTLKFTIKSSIKFTIKFTIKSINPIPAGVLENQDMLGGDQFDPPPSKSHVLCPNMTNDISLESYCALLLESAKKI